MEIFSRQKLVATSSSDACSSLKVILLLKGVMASVLWQSQHALADDVGLNLAGSAADSGRE
jgi:hypothetical protein